jgi:hypothetical protein
MAPFELLVDEHRWIPVTMSLAGRQEAVFVMSDVSVDVGGNIDRRQMADLPLAGRNWMELALQVQGVTGNDAETRPGVASDSAFQLNLDGQALTNEVASSSFVGQPRFSREAIAEIHVDILPFGITQGRSTGMQVEAISRSGTNVFSGSVYGYFRDDALNSKDFLAGRVLPYENQQLGASVGGPVVKDRWHYFGTYEYERAPNTAFFRPVNLPGQTFSYADPQTHHTMLGRLDQSTSPASRLAYRFSAWTFARPFTKQGEHPTQAISRTNHAASFLVNWTRARGGTVEELRIGYNRFGWQNDLAIPAMAGTPTYNLPGGAIGGPDSIPSGFRQQSITGRYDLTHARGSHVFTLGAEFLGRRDTGAWHIGERGAFNFRANPPDLERRFPADAVDQPERWDLEGLDAVATNFLQNTGDWSVDIPRPTYAAWFGDTWRVSDRLTLTCGLRYDLDRGATSPPDITNRTEFAPFGRPLFKDDVTDNDNVAPRVGLAWNVPGTGGAVVRGGSGLYYGTVVSNVTFSAQSFGNRIIANNFINDGRPGWLQDPTRNYTAEQIRAGATPQAPRVIAYDFAFPMTWQTALGFQQPLSRNFAVEMDLIHWKEYNRARARDINLVLDPATGYPAAGRIADPRWGPVLWIESHGRADYLALATAVRRRYIRGVQVSAAYTLMFYARDNQPASRFGPNADNPLNADDPSEWARSQEFQRHTLRLNGIWSPGWGLTVAGAYHFGSGNYFSTLVDGNPFGKSRAGLGLTNRLYLGPAITIRGPAGDRYEGPKVLHPGDRVPRNALRGLPIHKLDVHIAKRGTIRGIELEAVGEVFNLFNHENYGSYNAVVTSPQFGAPQQSLVNTYGPRTGQLALRVSF